MTHSTRTALSRVLAAVAFFAFMAAARAGESTRVDLFLHWQPQAQFAGFYLAQSTGEYEKRGLEVTITHATAQTPIRDAVLKGDADFICCSLSNALELVGSGQPLLLLSQIIQRSHLCLVTWKDAGIETPARFDGRRVSLWLDANGVFLKSFFKTNGVKPVVLPQGYSLALFLNRAVDACSAMAYNELNLFAQYGIAADRLRVFRMADYGLDLPEDGIYAPSDFIAANPETCRAFVDASLAGWRRAKDDPEAALDEVMRLVRENHVPTNRPHQEHMLKTILPTIFPDLPGLWEPGKLDPGSYNSVMFGSAALPETAGMARPPAYRNFVWETAR